MLSDKITQIQQATREELVAMLEERCIQCYEDESDEVLRNAAIEDAKVQQSENLQRFFDTYPGLMDATSRPMTESECGILLNLSMMPDTAVEEIAVKVSQDFIWRVACKWREGTNCPVDNRTLLFVVGLCANPAHVVMWLYSLCRYVRNNKVNAVTLQDFCTHIVPFGIPTDEAKNIRWDLQKIPQDLRGVGMTDNYLDLVSFWKLP